MNNIIKKQGAENMALRELVELWTINEVSQLTKIPTNTLYQLVWKKRIPVVRLSRRMLRFRPADIIGWIEQNSHHAQLPNRQIATVRKTNKHATRVVDYLVAKAREQAGVTQEDYGHKGR